MKTRALVLTGATLFALVGCTAYAPTATPGDARVLSVTASDDACHLSATTAPSGTLTFSVTNTGTRINEFYLLSADGLQVVAEVEDIGPGLTRDLVVSAPTGSYVTVCKPGMAGSGIKAPFEVTESGQPVEPAR